MNENTVDSKFHEIMNLDWNETQNDRRWEAPLIQTTYIWYPIMVVFRDILEQRRKKRMDNLVLYANTDSGKSTCADFILKDYSTHFNIPIERFIEIESPSNPLASGYCKYILKMGKWHYTKNDSIGELELKVKEMCERNRVYAIKVDDISNLANQVNEDELMRILQLIRNISQMNKVPLILIGVRKINSILSEDSQTNNRFIRAEFPRFRLNDGHWVYLQQFIYGLDAALEKTTQIKSNFYKNTNALEKLYQYSLGKVGSLIKIYEESVAIARQKNKTQLNVEYIDDSYKILKSSFRLHDEEGDQIELEKIQRNWWEIKS